MLMDRNTSVNSGGVEEAGEAPIPLPITLKKNWTMIFYYSSKEEGYINDPIFLDKPRDRFQIFGSRPQ
jgi:hypothetical protein